MRTSAPLLAALLLSSGLFAAGPAEAHRPYYRAYLTCEADNCAYLELKPTAEGRVKIQLSKPLPLGGTGTLVIDALLNRVPLSPLTYSLTAMKQSWSLGLPTKNQDKLEILGVRILDENGNEWAHLGAVAPPANTNLRGKYLFVSALIYVMDTASNVCYTRGGDATLLPSGFWTIGFDALRACDTGAHLNSQGLYGEIEFTRNGGSPETYSVTFDVKSGKSQPAGRPSLHFGFSPGDLIIVKRVEIFDSLGNMFAKVGIRMGAQGNYVQRHTLDTSISIGTGRDESIPHRH